MITPDDPDRYAEGGPSWLDGCAKFG